MKKYIEKLNFEITEKSTNEMYARYRIHYKNICNYDLLYDYKERKIYDSESSYYRYKWKYLPLLYTRYYVEDKKCSKNLYSSIDIDKDIILLLTTDYSNRKLDDNLLILIDAFFKIKKIKTYQFWQECKIQITLDLK